MGICAGGQKLGRPGGVQAGGEMLGRVERGRAREGRAPTQRQRLMPLPDACSPAMSSGERCEGARSVLSSDGEGPLSRLIDSWEKTTPRRDPFEEGGVAPFLHTAPLRKTVPQDPFDAPFDDPSGDELSWTFPPHSPTEDSRLNLLRGVSSSLERGAGKGGARASPTLRGSPTLKPLPPMRPLRRPYRMRVETAEGGPRSPREARGKTQRRSLSTLQVSERKQAKSIRQKLVPVGRSGDCVSCSEGEDGGSECDASEVSGGGSIGDKKPAAQTPEEAIRLRSIVRQSSSWLTVSVTEPKAALSYSMSFSQGLGAFVSASEGSADHSSGEARTHLTADAISKTGGFFVRASSVASDLSAISGEAWACSGRSLGSTGRSSSKNSMKEGGAAGALETTQEVPDVREFLRRNSQTVSLALNESSFTDRANVEVPETRAACTLPPRRPPVFAREEGGEGGVGGRARGGAGGEEGAGAVRLALFLVGATAVFQGGWSVIERISASETSSSETPDGSTSGPQLVADSAVALGFLSLIGAAFSLAPSQYGAAEKGIGNPRSYAFARAQAFLFATALTLGRGNASLAIECMPAVLWLALPALLQSLVPPAATLRSGLWLAVFSAVLLLSALTASADPPRARAFLGDISNPGMSQTLADAVAGHHILVSIALLFPLASRVASVIRSEASNEEVLTRLEDLNLFNSHLLHALVPRTIAARLGAGEVAIADMYPEATVLFIYPSSTVDMLLGYGVAATVQWLAKVFRTLDECLSQVGPSAVKVEQYSKFYLAAIGIGSTPNASTTNQASLGVDLALLMVQRLSEVLRPDGMPTSVQVGLSQGPVCAGVVGHRAPRYSIFGDTVNTASRMASSALVSTLGTQFVHFPASVREGLSEEYLASLETSSNLRMRCRGGVELRGKGRLTTFCLQRPDDPRE